MIDCQTELPKTFDHHAGVVAVQGPGEQRFAPGHAVQTSARLVMLLEPGGRILARNGPVGWISIESLILLL